LGEQNYLGITAFILDTNGARPGTQALAASSTVGIRSIATGIVPGAGAAKGKQQAKQAKQAAAAPRGITLAGEAKNFTPVTEAMLLKPDPADWLMIRHDYRANNFSPLNQVTASNANDLRLVWTWAMNNGTNQAAPIVHNGVMFINNPGNIVQALDAGTGQRCSKTRSTSPPAKHTSSRWTRAPERTSGTRPSGTAPSTVTPPAAGPLSSRAK
jgi:alcohol dehydrogenase (cytochrome c)